MLMLFTGREVRNLDWLIGLFAPAVILEKVTLVTKGGR